MVAVRAGEAISKPAVVVGLDAFNLNAFVNEGSDDLFEEVSR